MGEYKCQLSIKISAICQLSVKFQAFCQLPVKCILMINYEAYLYIFDAKVGVKGTYNVNETLNSQTDAIVPYFLSVWLL